MGIRFGFDEDKLTAVLVGEIDHHTAARLREEIDRKVGQMKPKELKLDFSQITFMDSSGIGLMMGRYRLMESLHGCLSIWNLSPQMERIVSLSGISRLVNIQHDRSVEELEKSDRNLETAEEGEETTKTEEIEEPAQEDSSRDIFSHSNRMVNGSERSGCNMNNEMKLSFPSCSSNEGFARAAVAAFVAQLDPTIEELSDLKTAVSEAVTNCIVHGYRDAIGVIYITATLSEDRRITVKIRDKGCGIPDIQQAMEPLFSTGGEERAGLGFSVMESFTDSLRVRSAVGKGTTVTMQKKLAGRISGFGH